MSDDFGNSATTAGAIAVGGQLSGSVELPADEDWFKVTLQAGTTYVFDLRGADGGGGTLGAGSAEARLALYDTSGYFEKSAIDGGTGGDPLMSFVPEVSGQYYLAVGDLYDSGTGTYTLRVSRSALADDYGNGKSTNGSVVVGGQVSGNIELPADEDWFKVTLQAGTTYVFDLRGADGGGGTLGAGSAEARLALYDTSGYFEKSAINGGTGGDPLMSFVPEVSGQYYLAVGDLYDSGTGTYTLRVSRSALADDYGNGKSTNGSVVVGGQVSGNIELPADEDWFKVTLQAGTTYVFDLRGADGGGGTLGAGSAEARLALYDTSGYFEKSAIDGGTGGDPSITYTPGITGTYFLAVEELHASGTGSYTLRVSMQNPINVITGSNGDDVLNGTTSADIIYGLGGNDTIDGGSGVDTMHGGDGNDTYYVRNPGDLVIEGSSAQLSGGVDTVLTSLSTYTLGANVENGRINTNGVASLIGNSLNNVLTAAAGDNLLDGRGGSDTADYSLTSSAVEVNLALTTPQGTGGSGSDTLISIENLSGSRYGDRLTGSSAANVIDGRAGADTMIGGDGSDIYYVDNVNDRVVETSLTASLGGVDTVYSRLSSYTLPTNVENGRINTTSSANISGNGLNNVLYAAAGDNVLDGGSGRDTAYYSSAGSAVTVDLAVAAAQYTGGSGTDTLISIEQLVGSRYADTLSGNSGSNSITGGGGSDFLRGGAGADTFVLNSLVGSDTIADFRSGTDKIRVSMQGIRVGDGDTSVEGAVSRSGPGGFAPGAELVVIGGDIAGSITASSAAAKIGSASSAYAAGARVLFAVDDGSASKLYLFTSAADDATVSAAELKLLASLTGTPATAVGDYVFGA